MSGSSYSASSPEAGAAAADVAAVVVAAGSGRRMGGAGETRKQFLEIGGVPVLQRALRAFLGHPRVGQTVAVLPAEQVDAPPAWLADLPVLRVAGGAERGDSVWNGLAAVGERARVVLVHDGARPFVDADLLDRVIAAAEAEGAALAALPVTDTIKEADPEGRVRRTLDRSLLWQAQTPQGFRLDLLREAHRRGREAGIRATDDAALCERLGIPVRLVQGSGRNLKITRPEDLALAQALARADHDRQLPGHAAIRPH